MNPRNINPLVLLLFALLPLMSFAPKATQSEGYYAILVVDGVWKDGTGYASRIIYYPGYSNCNRTENTYFFNAATRGFGDHLKSNYNGAFPYGENNNIRQVNTKQYSTSQLLKTRAEAEQRLTEWATEQKEKGYSVVYTGFGFSCENL